MTLRPTARAGTAALAACLVIAVLAGCDPVAWARRTPTAGATSSLAALGVPAPTATVPSPSPAPTPAVLSCASDADTAARIAGVSGAPVSRATDRSAFSAAVAGSDGRAVRLRATTVGFSNFQPNDTTLDGGELGWPAGGLIGAGEDRTTLQVVPGTSTRAADIPKTFPQTNQLDVLKVADSAAVLHGFTVRGTDQGHLYNGLRVSKVDDLSASDIRVVGIPGIASSPPGETFGINDFSTVGSHWSHIEVDGAGIGASGFATNSSRDVTVCDAVSKDNAAAMGFAFWQTTDILLVDCSAIDNGFSGFNFERVSGTVTLVRPTATGNRYGMRIASDQGSATYRIIDPVLSHGKWTVTMPKRWYGTANQQRASDITVIVDGKPRPDLLRIVRY